MAVKSSPTEAAALPADLQQLRDSAGKAAVLLRSVANEQRLLILCHLASGEKSVGDLERVVSVSQSALSQHLAVLRRDGLVVTRRSGQTIHYRLQGDQAIRLLAVLHDLFCEARP